MGKMDSRIALRSFEEVRAHNAAGQCWLVLDGELSLLRLMSLHQSQLFT